MKSSAFVVLAVLVVLPPALFAQQRQRAAPPADGSCFQTTMLKPSPFLGTANEIIVLADGSIWEDMSYKYLYLYAYNPPVLMCPSQGRMLVDTGGTVHSFTVVRIR